VNEHSLYLRLNEPCLDGGGIRGVSELLILDEIMRRVQHDLDLAELPRPCDYFDLIGGTSTGGYDILSVMSLHSKQYMLTSFPLSLIALMLGRLQMTTDEALRAYNSLSQVIFSVKNKKRKDQDGSFKASTLQQKVQEIVAKKGLGEFMLDPSINPRKGKAFVCAVPANNMAYTRRFRTYRVRANASTNCRIWEAARATTAAPTFFKRIAIGEEGHAKEEFIDGALGCNNPVNQVLDEARVIFGNDRPVRCLVSIGTGHPGKIGLAKPDGFQKILPIDLIHVLKQIATDCEGTATQLKTRFENIEKFYFRFNVAHGAEGISLEEWKKMGELTEHTKAYMARKSKKIDEVVALLCEKTEVRLTLGDVCQSL
jgi:predicted acylesterase/phospholipase RssA